MATMRYVATPAAHVALVIQNYGVSVVLQRLCCITRLRGWGRAVGLSKFFSGIPNNQKCPKTLFYKNDKYTQSELNAIYHRLHPGNHPIIRKDDDRIRATAYND